jgi:hypothetical protein
MSKRIKITLSPDLYELVRMFAEDEKRTLANTVHYAMLCAFENRPMERLMSRPASRKR